MVLVPSSVSEVPCRHKTAECANQKHGGIAPHLQEYKKPPASIIRMPAATSNPTVFPLMPFPPLPRGRTAVRGSRPPHARINTTKTAWMQERPNRFPQGARQRVPYGESVSRSGADKSNPYDPQWHTGHKSHLLSSLIVTPPDRWACSSAVPNGAAESVRSTLRPCRSSAQSRSDATEPLRPE